MKFKFLSLGLVLFSMVSNAEVNSHYGTFCSMSARDGIWALSFAETSINTNCRLASDAIRRVTWAPIHGSNSGYYSRYGWNEVTASCYFLSERFVGRGVEPLQRAYWTMKNFASDCIFYVRY